MPRLPSWAVSDAFWKRVEPLLPPPTRDPNKSYMEAVSLTRKGVFFQNFAQLGDLLKLTEAERDVLLFVMLFREEPGLRQALHELNCCGVQEFYDHLARILKVPEAEIRLAVRKDGILVTAGLVQVYKGVHRSVELEPLEGLYKALWKAEGGVEGILSAYFTKCLSVINTNFSPADYGCC